MARKGSNQVQSKAYPCPALLKPTGTAYMPLYSAIQWVATQGLAQWPDNTDEDQWRGAYRAVLAAVVDQRVKAVGYRNGIPENIPAQAFGLCAIVHFWEGYDGDLATSGELYLRGGVYADDDQWKSDNSDALVIGAKAVWNLITVAQPDILREWPFELGA